MLRKILPILIGAPLLLCNGCSSSVISESNTVNEKEFASLITEISEESGYFWSSNFISNETSYLHAMGPLRKLGVREGAYIGVGPSQNFTYIAQIRPRIAFIIDIRRQNMLMHLIFKILMEKAGTRQEYLSFLTGRPIQGPLLPQSTPLEDLVAYFENTEPDQEFFRRQLSDVIQILKTRVKLQLTPADMEDVEHILGEFFRQGLDIKYDSWRAFFFPTWKELLLETDRNGNCRNWLASAESYQFVRNMQLANLIIPVVGDFAGTHTFSRLADILENHGEKVSAFYLSNVEFYLFRQRKWDHFVDNIRLLPIDEKSVLIRAYANLHRPHPLMLNDHITVTLVQNTMNFLHNFDDGLYRSLWDVVTLDYVD